MKRAVLTLILLGLLPLAPSASQQKSKVIVVPPECIVSFSWDKAECVIEAGGHAKCKNLRMKYRSGCEVVKVQ